MLMFTPGDLVYLRAEYLHLHPALQKYQGKKGFKTGRPVLVLDYDAERGCYWGVGLFSNIEYYENLARKNPRRNPMAIIHSSRGEDWQQSALPFNHALPFSDDDAYLAVGKNASSVAIDEDELADIIRDFQEFRKSAKFYYYRQDEWDF